MELSGLPGYQRKGPEARTKRMASENGRFPYSIHLESVYDSARVFVLSDPICLSVSVLPKK